jgi:polysaccharide biosynthesis/export protein
MRAIRFMLRWALSLVLAATAGAAVAQAAPDLADYTLGTGDVVRIQVFQNNDLTTEGRVSETGQITFPLLGNLRVAGMTPGAVERMVAERLREGGYVQRAQVTMGILQFRSQQVSVLGSVNRPGRYPLETRGTRLTELLATAGGVTPNGSDTLILVRRQGDKVIRHEVDVPGLYLNQGSDRDLEVLGGDSIFVHRAPVYYVFGQVQRPGQYTVERAMNVRQALAKGGGFTMRARENSVVIRRTDASGSSTEVIAGLDDVVRPDDQIYVRESLF